MPLKRELLEGMLKDAVFVIDQVHIFKNMGLTSVDNASEKMQKK